jgi:sulfoxide reductase heme-binding subunit YedZ
MTSRLARRILRHHIPIGAISIASAFALYITRSYPDVLTRLSFSSAYPALVLIGITLVIGPLKVISGERIVISLDIRRDIGIWAGLMGAFHAIVGQCVHLRGRPWLYYIYENWEQKHALPVRHDLFGLANYTGLIAALALLLLLATSNDASVRKLGVSRWKRIQRWNYYCFVLTAVHTLTYQVGIESPQVVFVSLAALVMVVAGLFQLTGYRRRRAVLTDGSATGR